jgi:hypothetical protein
MGKEYFKRQLMTAGTTAGSTSGSVGNLRVGGNLVVPAESITGTAGNNTLSDHGVSFLTVATSNLGNDFVMPAPPAAGAVKYVFVNFATTSGDEFSLHAGATVAGSSANVWFGTTANTITGNAIAAATIPVGGSPGLLFIGVSTSQWAVSILGSTVLFNLTASTGSTSQN